MMRMNISFIGGGNMARAIIGGLKNNGFDMTNICVIEPNAATRAALTSEFNVQTFDTYVENFNTPKTQSVIILAVKPQILQEVCQQLAPKLVNQQTSPPLIISIAAGIRSQEISRWLGYYSAIVRVMPNTPAQIQAGISALYALSLIHI